MQDWLLPRRILAGGRAFIRTPARCVAALMSLVLLAAVIGIMPTPAWLGWLTGHAAGVRYPCEGGRCGCSSVRECWTTCACHTLEQKVAWAQREGVAIPDFVDLTNLNTSPLLALAQPACPLCEGDEPNPDTESDAQDNASAADNRPRLPELGPLGCKSLQMLMAVAIPVPVMGTAIELEPGTGSIGLVSVPAERKAPVRFGEVPTPPPKG